MPSGVMAGASSEFGAWCDARGSGRLLARSLRTAEPYEALSQKLERLLDAADVRINADRPWDIRVHNPDVYARIWEYGTLGVGGAYMDGWWDCDRLDEMVARIQRTECRARSSPP